ncbi:hypothetical protein BH20ACT8_BH20ACT8_20920 [soil metagenome]
MGLGSSIVVPVVNPQSAGPLMRFAAVLAAADAGIVVPVTVVRPDARQRAVADAHALVQQAEVQVAQAGGTARGVVTVAEVTAEGVLEAVDDREATLVVMGWRGVSSTHNVFGELIDSIVGRSSVPLAVIRLGQMVPARILFPVSTEHLLPAGARGMQLAGELVTRYQSSRSLPVVVLRAGSAHESLPAEVSALGDRVHHDTRRVDLAVGAVSRPDDLIVTPVAPTTSGLRAATTHLAWAAPEASLVVAVDVGPRSGDLAEAVDRAAEPPPPPAAQTPAAHHLIRVTVWPLGAEPVDGERLGVLLGDVGSVRGTEEATEDGRACVRGAVDVPAGDTNAALAVVMDRLHEARALRGAEIRYDVEG